MRVILSRAAEADLDEILVYVANSSGSLEIGRSLLRAISKRLDRIGRFPLIGKRYEAGPDLTVRTLLAGNYIIFYSVRDNEIRILRIIHSSRDAFAVFAGEWS